MAFGAMPAPSSIPGASTENPSQRWGFLRLCKGEVREVPELTLGLAGNRASLTRALALERGNGLEVSSYCRGVVCAVRWSGISLSSNRARHRQRGYCRDDLSGNTHCWREERCATRNAGSAITKAIRKLKPAPTRPFFTMGAR